MGEPEVTETRESYHDIGICVTVFDNKVAELLRKTVAHELSCDYDTLFEQLQQISSYSNQINFVSYQILKDIIYEEYPFGQCMAEIQYRPDYNDMFFQAFEEMIHKFYTTLNFQIPEDLANPEENLLFFLDGNFNPDGHQNFVKVLIERFMLDVKCTANVLNNLLGRLNVGNDWKLNIIYPCLDENGTLIRPRHNFCNDTVGCKYRYRRREADKGPWDWVNEMKYIRNDVVHSDFKFEDNQNEQNFLRKYRRFIDAIDFAVLFPLNGDDARDEYLNIIEVHKVVKGEVGRLKDEVGWLTDDVGWLTDDVGWLTDEVGRLKDEVGGLTDDVGRWKDEVGRLKDEVDTFNESNELLEAMLALTVADKQCLEDENKRWEAYSKCDSDKASRKEEEYYRKPKKTKQKYRSLGDT